MGPKYNLAIIAGQLVVGGAERQLCLWLSHLDRQKYRPVVATLHPGHGDYWEDYIESLDIPLLRIPHRFSRLVRLLDIVRELRPYEPDLIHGWHLFASPYAGLAAKFLGAKSLGGVRGTFRSFRDSSLESYLTLRLVDAILVNSATTAGQLLKARKRNDQSFFVVQNAVESHTVDRNRMRGELAGRFGFSPQGMWIGSLARLDPGKRFDLLLKVIALLKEDIKEFHCILIGDGPERFRLERMAVDLGISPYVTFAGEVPAASAWLGALDVFGFTSMDEGLPNAVMEAAAAGLPVVSWRTPFIEELFDESQGALLIEPGDLVGFKKRLLELARSPELRLKLGDSGRAHILERFSLDRFVLQMTAVYEQLLGPANGRES